MTDVIDDGDGILDDEDIVSCSCNHLTNYAALVVCKHIRLYHTVVVSDLFGAKSQQSDKLYLFVCLLTHRMSVAEQETVRSLLKPS